ncbi:MAG: flagellar basal body P-ring formation chaperone FlgA [Polyangiaceae bacterium]
MQSIHSKSAPVAASYSPRRAKFVGILTLAASALTLHVSAQPSERQSPESIRAAARALVIATLDAPATTIVETTSVDERLRLAPCSQELDAQMQRALVNGQGTVAVECRGGSPWRLFVPVRVIAQVAVVVARRALAAGEVLTAADLDTHTQASTSLPYDYLSDIEGAVGLTLRRSVPAGALLVPAALVHPELVARGALVTLVSGAGPIRVRSSGVALEAGRVKQRVKVRSESGRVIEGVVEASGEVRVGT